MAKPITLLKPGTIIGSTKIIKVIPETKNDTNPKYQCIDPCGKTHIIRHSSLTRSFSIQRYNGNQYRNSYQKAETPYWDDTHRIASEIQAFVDRHTSY